MNEPNILDAKINCPDCFGSGEIEYEYGMAGDLEPRSETIDCSACHGTGEARLGDLATEAEDTRRILRAAVTKYQESKNEVHNH